MALPDTYGHIPRRPTWDCSSCGQPWPCRSKQRRLQAEYRDAPISLYLALSMRLVDATADLRHVPAGALYDRFVRWANIRLPQTMPTAHDPGEPS